MADNLRLTSILAQLPRPRRVLELGCGRDPAVIAPDAAHVAIDHDSSALQAIHRPVTDNLLRIQADIARLPFRARFDLILARHPDVDRHTESWHYALSHAPNYLNPGGLLLITVYSPPEVELVRSWAIPLRSFPLDERKLCESDLVGADRFALCWQSE